MRKRLDSEAEPEPVIQAPPFVRPMDGLHVLSALDLSAKIDDDTYEEQLEKAERKLSRVTRDPRFGRTSVVLVFEGSDAAGKGGAIRRITGALDARLYRVVPIAAPTEEERAQPYLWR